jgi:hypothetical protein
MNFCVCWLNLFADLLRLLVLSLRSKTWLAAENLFLRKQLSLYQERKIRPRRIDTPRLFQATSFARDRDAKVNCGLIRIISAVSARASWSRPSSA